jgi:MOSC domain
MTSQHLSLATLVASLPDIRQSPLDGGRLELIVRRPAVGEREVLPGAEVDDSSGVDGDNWLARGSSSTPDGRADPRAQVTVANWRAVLAVAGSAERVPLAGDQLYVDLDLSSDNLPAGTWLSIGSAVLEVSDKPHPGCAKFRARFGGSALRFVNTGAGKELRLRGINTRVAQSGTVRLGDVVRVSRAGSRCGSSTPGAPPTPPT